MTDTNSIADRTPRVSAELLRRFGAWLLFADRKRLESGEPVAVVATLRKRSRWSAIAGYGVAVLLLADGLLAYGWLSQSEATITGTALVAGPVQVAMGVAKLLLSVVFAGFTAYGHGGRRATLDALERLLRRDAAGAVGREDVAAEAVRTFEPELSYADRQLVRQERFGDLVGALETRAWRSGRNMLPFWGLLLAVQVLLSLLRPSPDALVLACVVCIVGTQVVTAAFAMGRTRVLRELVESWDSVSKARVAGA